ncbi:hypothetical protein BpHYR1_049267 [Brachionus plicatilis]|uniref:Uncharacterized protein n=1 Tax=Brachionus plicatilis TaxID=10195 RepID=A0A3M7R6T8_BRAPC|nr:hypothetical protein BpHYR1_049267 [Brachionus plicatilis]
MTKQVLNNLYKKDARRNLIIFLRYDSQNPHNLDLKNIFHPNFTQISYPNRVGQKSKSKVKMVMNII